MFGINRKNNQKEEQENSLHNSNSHNLSNTINDQIPTALNSINTTNLINNKENLNLQNMTNDINISNSNSSNNPINWTEDFSWSRILMSDSESLRQIGAVYRQKDTNMVALVRRLEYFPSLKLISSTRKLFEDEIFRLNKVKEVVDFESNQLKETNPILTQAGMEVESELSKITIEMESFEKKLSSEVKIVDHLVQTIIAHENKKPESIAALLRIYEFDLDKNNIVIHKSSLSQNPATQAPNLTNNNGYNNVNQNNKSTFPSLKPAEVLSKTPENKKN